LDLEELDKIQLEQRGVTKGELEPFHIGIKMKEILEQAHTMGIEAGGDFLVKAVEEINEKTPDWYWCVAEVGDKELSYYDSFDHEKMGDELIKKYHLVRFPKLLEGAVYDSSRGYWRYFGKNEMKTFAEKDLRRYKHGVFIIKNTSHQHVPMFGRKLIIKIIPILRLLKQASLS